MEEKREEESELTKEELIKQLKRMKIGKTPGEDGLENEVWKYMPNSIGKAVWKMIKKLWREGGIAEEWKKGVICPIYKKGEKGDARNIIEA